MKKMFIKDDRLREILADRNKKIEVLLRDGKLRGSISVKLSTREFKDGTSYGWEIIDFENRQKIEKKGKIEPTGTITPTEDFFSFKSKNLGVFKKPKIERKGV